jgi:hypothetical protein
VRNWAVPPVLAIAVERRGGERVEIVWAPVIDKQEEDKRIGLGTFTYCVY